jgi:DNA-binding SARP family transcriptional activator/tetratricopeptide (TPR) repeat protein
MRKKQPASFAVACVSLVGSARATDHRGARIALPEKTFLLMAFLALARPGHFAARNEMARFLWPDAPRRQASANLRQLLSRIRHAQEAAGVELITTTSSHIHLRASEVWIDVLELNRLIGDISWTNLPEIFELFGNGQLLSGGAVEEDLRDWVTDQRSRLSESFIAGAMKILEGGDLGDHAALAKAVARRILDVDSYHEPAFRALMRAYAAEGRIYEARRVFEQCRALFENELSVGPDSETVATLHQLLRGEAGSGDHTDRRPEASPAAVAPSSRGYGDDNGNGPAPGAADVPKIAILMPARGPASHDLHAVATSLLEDVTLGLCSLRTITVIAPHTSWQMSADPQIQGSVERFGVTYLVESNLHGLHNPNSLSLKLLDAQSRAILWAQRVPLGNLQLAASYRDICVGLVPSIADALERAEIKRHESENDRAAYYWYLQGQRHLRQIDLPNIRRARRAFHTAIASGAPFAPAYSGAARTLQMEWILLARGDQAVLAKSEKLARRAIDLDPRDSGGYHQLGFASLYARRFDESIAQFTQAERRHPQHADLLADFADALAHSGQPAAGLKKLKQAMVLNPIVPDQYWWRASGMNYQLHRYEEAINCALRMKDSGPALRLVAASYAQLGDKASAGEYVEKTLETYPDFRVEHWLSIVPNRNPDDNHHYKQGLRAAGFP